MRFSIVCVLVIASQLGSSTRASAQCPIPTVISVDNDIAGSGYSEVNPQNWVSSPVGTCRGNYRYLSHTVGDGTRKGKAIWRPKITITGYYDVEISYRATANRTPDADYFVYDDNGGVKHVVINQKHTGDCTRKVLGNFYCKQGGSCRVVLDGTDDGESDAADISRFTLTRCSGKPPPPGLCDKIKQKAKYEVCSQTATTCAGTYDDGSGCVAYCAAANMICVARFGGQPGCQKEPQTKIPCNAINTNQSDWCECASPPRLDAGVATPDSAGAPADAAAGNKDSAIGNPDAVAVTLDARPTDPARDGGADLELAGDGSGARPSVSGGCSCRTSSDSSSAWLAISLLLFLFWQRKRRR